MFSLRCGRRSIVPAMATTHPGLTLPQAPGSLQALTEHVPLRVFLTFLSLNSTFSPS